MRSHIIPRRPQQFLLKCFKLICCSALVPLAAMSYPRGDMAYLSPAYYRAFCEHVDPRAGSTALADGASHDVRVLSRCPFESQMICCSCCLANKGSLRVICRGEGCFHIVCTSCAPDMVCPHCVPKTHLVGSSSSLLRQGLLVVAAPLDGVPGRSVEDYLIAEDEPEAEPEKCDKIGSKRRPVTKSNVCKKKPAASPGRLQLQK